MTKKHTEKTNEGILAKVPLAIQEKSYGQFFKEGKKEEEEKKKTEEHKEGKVCVLRDNLGECLEWQELGGKVILIFKEEERKCNPELYGKWKDAVKNKRITVLPED